MDDQQIDLNFVNGLIPINIALRQSLMVFLYGWRLHLMLHRITTPHL